MKFREDAIISGASGIKPVWWVVAGCFTLLAALALANYTRFPFRELNFFTFLWALSALLIAHTALNARTYLSQYRSGGDLLRTFLHDMLGYIPYLLMAALYDNVSLYEPAVRLKVHDLDLLLMKMDGLMFGVQPTIFLERHLYPFLVEYFMIAYTLFLLPFVYLVYLFQKGEKAAFDTVILAQVIASTIAIISFIFLPAKGPRHLFDPANAGMYRDLPRFSRAIEGIRINALEEVTGSESLYRIQHDGWNRLERVKTDCMPSMHTALYLICLIGVVRFRKKMKWRTTALAFWSVSFASLVFSCVYLRYHWVVDVFAGIAVASFSFAAAEKIVGRWLAFKERPPERDAVAAEMG